jgi:nucleoside-diphosphate-sugar epimerase
MAGNTALVIGATGASATRLVEHLSGELGWKVYGACRTAPPDGAAFLHVGSDLMNADAVRTGFAELSDVTHVFYAARAAHGEGGLESVEDNVTMLRNVLDGLDGVAVNLAHVHLVEGGKWYGLHIGPYRTPAREDQPRHLPPNFYYDQQDLLEARAADGGWTWSASRPNVLCDFAPQRARNLVSIIAAYAAICRAANVPLDFPGSRGAFETLTEVTDARLFARALAWMGTTEAAGNQAFNITNGDVFRWSTLWPVIADYFAVRCGEPRAFRLASWMADKQPLWSNIASRHGLSEAGLERVANWEFGDFVFGQDYDVISDLGRIRRAGFCDTIDTEAMFIGHFDAYRKAGLLP